MPSAAPRWPARDARSIDHDAGASRPAGRGGRWRARRRLAGRARARVRGAGRPRTPPWSPPTRSRVRCCAETPDVVTFTYDERVAAHRRLHPGVRRGGRAGRLDRSTSEDKVVTRRPSRRARDGTYVVAWRVVSADGHPISGSLTFSIGAPSETVVPPDVDAGTSAGTKTDLGIAQGLGYAGLLVAAGLAVFGAWMLGDVRLVAGVGGSAAPNAALRDGGRDRRGRARRPPGGGLSAGPRLEGLTDPAAYDLDLVGDDLLVLGLQARGPGRGSAAPGPSGCPRPPRPRWRCGRRPWSVTRAPIEPVPLLVVTDALHLSAGAVWLGGLVGLALTLPAIRGRRRADTATVVSRFSSVAAGVLALLVASGTLMGWRILGSWDALFGTTYGRLLLVKVGIALLVVAIAAWNRYRLLPRVTGSVGHEEGVAATGLVRPHRGRRGLPAARGPRRHRIPGQPAAPRAAGSGRARAGRASRASLVGDLRVLATLTPGERGANTVTVQIQDQAGDPVDVYAAPEVSLASDDVDLGVVPARPGRRGDLRRRGRHPVSWRVAGAGQPEGDRVRQPGGHAVVRGGVRRPGAVMQ